MLRVNQATNSAESGAQALPLSRFQKILLAGNGTTTNLLQSYLGEPLQLIKLGQELKTLTLAEPCSLLNIESDHQVLARKILLQSAQSRQVLLYAESYLVLERLAPHMRDELINEQTVIGHLIVKYRMETFREVLRMSKERAGAIGAYFSCDPDDWMLTRTYRLWSNQQPTMLIYEKFPESHFVD